MGYEWERMEGKWHPSIPQHLVMVLTAAGDEVGPVTGVATGCHCQQVATTLSAHDNPLLCNFFSRKKTANVLSTTLNPQHLEFKPLNEAPGALPWPPSCPWYWPELSSWPSDDPVHGPIYCGSWVQMIFLPSPAPVFLVSWLQMTTLERAEWRFYKQFAPWICKSNIKYKPVSLICAKIYLFVGEWSCTVKWLINNINNKSYLIIVSLYCIHTLRAVTTIDIETSIFEILALIMQHSCC